MNKRLSLSITPTNSTSSGLASRRRNNKNLSLCLSPESTSQLLNVPQEKQQLKQQKDDVNAYPLGPAKIMPFLYLGSEKNALDLDHLKQLNVQAILNVAAEVNNPYEYLFQSMDDLLSSSIIPSPSLSKASSVSSTASSIQTIIDSAPTTQLTTHVAYQKLPWQHNQDNLAVELSKAIDIIDRARNAGQTILVHCQCGVARSATVIIAYIMKTYNMPMQDAYNHVKGLAPPISPNLGFLFQLREFEQKIHPTVVEPQQLQPPPTPTVATTPQVLKQQQSIIGHNPSRIGRPKSWIGLTNPNTASPSDVTSKPKKNTFLIRASSLCLTGAWKRKLKTKPLQKTDSQQPPLQQPQPQQSQQQQQQQEDGWWKTKKVSVDTTSICC